MSDKELNIDFAPGAFDHFEGTQQELNDLVAEIKNLALHGNLEQKTQPVDMDALAEQDPQLYEILMKQLSDIDQHKRDN